MTRWTPVPGLNLDGLMVDSLFDILGVVPSGFLAIASDQHVDATREKCD